MGGRGTAFDVKYQEVNGVGTTILTVYEGIVEATDNATGDITQVGSGGTYGWDAEAGIISATVLADPIHISKSASAALTLPLAPSAIRRVMVMGAAQRRARKSARDSFPGGWRRTDWKLVSKYLARGIAGISQSPNFSLGRSFSAG
jgi:hypothetical protein